MFASATLTQAGPGAYRFEAVETQAAALGHITVEVRLVRGPDNTPVDRADIIEAKTDMGPDGMPDMTGKVTPVASDRPGLYRFSIETGMAGNWELVLTVRVPGETAPVTSKVDYRTK
jgi:hypothetical protein